MFILRRGGTNDFVSEIIPDADYCSPPGDVNYVEGWTNPDMLTFTSLGEAEAQKKIVEYIDGCHISIEKKYNPDYEEQN